MRTASRGGHVSLQTHLELHSNTFLPRCVVDSIWPLCVKSSTAGDDAAGNNVPSLSADGRKQRVACALPSRRRDGGGTQLSGSACVRRLHPLLNFLIEMALCLGLLYEGRLLRSYSPVCFCSRIYCNCFVSSSN